MMRVLVTGGAGYIGSHCCKYFAERGATILTVDSLERGHQELVKWSPLAQGDVADREFLERTMHEFKPDCVLHLAGYIDIEESTRLPELYLKKNVEVTKVLLSVMKDCGVNQLVFSSTCAIYDAPTSPASLVEGMEENPKSGYSISKKKAELAIEQAAHDWGLRYAILRYFNASGADLASETGEWHEPETHVIPLLIQTLLGQRKTFYMFGDDYPTPDGTAIRDYIHVNDIASAHWQAVDYLRSGGNSEIFNIGSGQGISVKELVTKFEAVAGAKVPVEIKPRRAGDVAMLYADPTKAKKMLGWNPIHSDIEMILRTALAWHRTLA